MKKILGILCLLMLIIITSCIKKYGRDYQTHNDFKSLSKVVSHIEIGVDTNYVKQLLGEPINFGFEYRYLTDSISEEGCPVGAVFHVTNGKITSKMLLPICEWKISFIYWFLIMKSWFSSYYSTAII